MPAEGFSDANNSYVEIELSKVSEINTAIIEEVGNQAQYFRLQALLMMNGLHAIKVKRFNLCVFAALIQLFRDRIRLSIDKFGDEDTPVKIKLIKLL